LLGSNAVLNNFCLYLNPTVDPELRKELEMTLGIPVCGGSVNRGTALVGIGCVCNDRIVLAGKKRGDSDVRYFYCKK